VFIFRKMMGDLQAGRELNVLIFYQFHQGNWRVNKNTTMLILPLRLVYRSGKITLYSNKDGYEAVRTRLFLYLSGHPPTMELAPYVTERAYDCGEPQRL